MRRRLLCWLVDKWFALVAKYHVWNAFHVKPWQRQPKREDAP